MRALTFVLVALLVLIQYPLWLGKGGWLRVWELDRQLQGHNRLNNELVRRNTSLAAEVKDLKEGAGAVEERARFELGMLKEGELFVHVTEGAAGTSPPRAQEPPVAVKPPGQGQKAPTVPPPSGKSGTTPR